MGPKKPFHGVRHRLLYRAGDSDSERRGLLRLDHWGLFADFLVQAPQQSGKVPIRSLAISRLERLPHSLAAIIAISVEGASAFVEPECATARPEKRARPEVPPVRVKVGIFLHGRHITSTSGFRACDVRLAYIRAAAVGEIVIVV